MVVGQNIRFLFGDGYHPVVDYFEGCSAGYQGFDPHPYKRRWLCFLGDYLSGFTRVGRYVCLFLVFLCDVWLYKDRQTGLLERIIYLDYFSWAAFWHIQDKKLTYG